jgi:hypothetical protein
MPFGLSEFLTIVGLRSRVLEQFELEIQFLQQGGVPSGLLKGHAYRENLLQATAFHTKRFNVTLQKGNFWPPAEKHHSKHEEWKPKYEYCLRFDKSPFPPPEEWKSIKRGPEKMKYWNIKEFTRSPIVPLSTTT